MTDEQLSAFLTHLDVEAFALLVNRKPSGLLELDFREEGQCELAFFGVAREAIGTSAGRYLMNEVITRAWERPIKRLWVHTSTLDHPAALAFTPYQRMIEIHNDPRLNGLLPRTAAPHVPLIDFSQYSS
jgi:N-acetylglutamate synthase-like GNAT family acetyltransferase